MWTSVTLYRGCYWVWSYGEFISQMMTLCVYGAISKQMLHILKTTHDELLELCLSSTWFWQVAWKWLLASCYHVPCLKISITNIFIIWVEASNLPKQNNMEKSLSRMKIKLPERFVDSDVIGMSAHSALIKCQHLLRQS